MNYEKIYQELISKGKLRGSKRSLSYYTEEHHVIPRCMNGSDDKNNLVALLPREHFVAHRLLTKIYPEVKGLHYAVNLMRYNKGVKLTSRTIATLRENNAKAFSGKNNPMFGKPSWIRGMKLLKKLKPKCAWLIKIKLYLMKPRPI